jgi:hypothetical protein
MDVLNGYFYAAGFLFSGTAASSNCMASFCRASGTWADLHGLTIFLNFQIRVIRVHPW